MRRNEEWEIRFGFCVEANFELRWYFVFRRAKGKESGGRWRKFNEQKEKKVGVGGENLMPMVVDGIVGELFIYFSL